MMGRLTEDTSRMNLNRHYERLRKSVELTAKGYFNCCFIQGSPGLGKSFQTTATLKELGFKEGRDYIEFVGDISVAFLYRFIYANNGKIIIFRDLARLLRESKGIDLFKGMTETHGVRRVSKATYNKYDKDLPQSFVVQSNFIFEFNSIGTGRFKEDLTALFSRGDYARLSFSAEQVEEIMMQVCRNEEERHATRFLLENFRDGGFGNLNLRTQQKAFRIVRYARNNQTDWKEELRVFLDLDMSATRRVLYPCLGNGALKTGDLKRLLVKSGIANSLRTADRRIREWILLGELFVAGCITQNVEELERFLELNRNFLVSLNPMQATQATGQII